MLPFGEQRLCLMWSNANASLNRVGMKSQNAQALSMYSSKYYNCLEGSLALPRCSIYPQIPKHLLFPCPKSCKPSLETRSLREHGQVCRRFWRGKARRMTMSRYFESLVVCFHLCLLHHGGYSIASSNSTRQGLASLHPSTRTNRIAEMKRREDCPSRR